MKKFFKGLLYLFIAVIIAILAYQQFNNWQDRTDLAEQAESPQGQLPDWLIPNHYDLALKGDPDNASFSGEINIKVALSQATQELW